MSNRPKDIRRQQFNVCVYDNNTPNTQNIALIWIENDVVLVLISLSAGACLTQENAIVETSVI